MYVTALAHVLIVWNGIFNCRMEVKIRIEWKVALKWKNRMEVKIRMEKYWNGRLQWMTLPGFRNDHSTEKKPSFSGVKH